MISREVYYMFVCAWIVFLKRGGVYYSHLVKSTLIHQFSPRNDFAKHVLARVQACVHA